MKQLIALLVFLAFMMVGCSTTPHQTPIHYTFTPVAVSQIQSFIFETNHVDVPNYFIQIDDDHYAIPSEKWVNDEFSPFFSNWLFVNNLMTYHIEDNDCDDFSDYGIAMARFLYHNAPFKAEGYALAVGRINYMTNPIPHAVNFFIVTDKNGQWKLRFYEPQVQDFMDIDIKKETILFFKM